MVFAHSAGVFAHGAIAGVVMSVFYAPMLPDSMGSVGWSGLEVGNIIGSLTGGFPKASLGIAVETVALDADDSFDQPVPIAISQGVAQGKGLGAALFTA